MTAGARVGSTGRPVGGVAAVLVAATVWGTTGTATHFAPGVPAFVFGAVTFGLGGLVLAVSGGQGSLRAVAQPGVRRWVWLGAVALTVYAVAFYAALADAGVALGTTVAIGSSPVFAGVVEWVAERRWPGPRWVVATGISVAGMVVVTLARSEDAGASVDSGSGTVLLGVGAALVAGATYALYSWAVARGMGGPGAAGVDVGGPGAAGVDVGGPGAAGVDAGGPGAAGVDVGGPGAAGVDAGGPGADIVAGGPGARVVPVSVPPVVHRGRGVVGAVFGLAAVPLVVLAALVGRDALVVPGNWPVFLYLALVPTVLGHSLYAVGLRTVRASVATLVSLCEPVVAAVLAVLVVGEHLGAVGWAGVALVVLGVGLLALPSRRAATSG